MSDEPELTKAIARLRPTRRLAEDAFCKCCEVAWVAILLALAVGWFVVSFGGVIDHERRIRAIEDQIKSSKP